MQVLRGALQAPAMSVCDERRVVLLAVLVLVHSPPPPGGPRLELVGANLTAGTATPPGAAISI
ncbi:hypothetical protein ACQEU6_02350 [Spirillospora sp. CA-108201]